MGTPNFNLLQNADNFYAVCMEIEDHWEYDDFKQHFIDCFLEKFGGQSLDEEHSTSSRSYHVQSLACFDVSKTFGDITCEIRFTSVIQSAYYQGATLDFSIEGSNEHEFWEITNRCYAEYSLEDFTRDLFEVEYDDTNFSEMSKGLRVIQSKHALNWAKETVEKYSSELNEFLKSFSEHELVKTAQFSNGEAVYEPVK